MARRWTDDEALTDAISGNLYDALPCLPKRLIRVDAITREFEMPFSHIQILSMLSEGEMSIGDLSMSLGIAKPNITPLLDAMHTRGLLERFRSTADHRIVIIRLLPKGQEMTQQILQSIAGQVKSWPDDFSMSDMKRLNNALAYLVEVARRLSDMEREN